MRLLFLLTQDLESPSGLGRYLPLAQELVKLGHHLTIAALHSDYDNLNEKRQCLDGVEVLYIGQMHVRKRGNHKFYFSPVQLLFLTAWATIKMAWLTLRYPADIVYVCKPHPMNSLAGLAGKILRKRRLFLDCDDYEAAGNRFSGKWQKQIIRFFEDWIPLHAAIVTTNTQFNRERLIQIGIAESNIFYLPNGVDPSRFQVVSIKALDDLRENLSVCGKKVIVYVGSLSLVSHPVDLLVQAFARIHQAKPETVLILVGGGDDFDNLRAITFSLELGEHVIFTGRISPDEVVKYYQLGDVSVDPVYDDDAARGRCPLKLFESWMCGVPFVSADVGDRRGLVEQPQAGVLAQAGDVDSLAETIQSVLENPSMANQLREEGLKKVKMYTWDQLARGLDERVIRVTPL